ncbi:MAG: ABC transporter ATP-binding protein [Phycisphaerales bacterium JB040]
MTYPALILDGIGKSYQIGLREPGADGLGSALKSLATAPLRNFRKLSGRSEERELFWALRDVSFEVPAGQVMGIVGRNGAGKSTMLKVLSRITEPSEGSARLRGRVASLIEVGTGFHPELTGRENIYLNGAILGMTRSEIDTKFDEIVDFSEVERFLDTPVKRYSSGMFLRLAFAVAAYLEPEIHVIDEVLAVGDAAFQKKCLGRMKDISHGHGRTVLFVSHNMATVRALCDRCVMLKGGRLVADGEPGEVIDRYLDMTMAQAGKVYDLSNRTSAWKFGTGTAVFTRLEFANQSNFVDRTSELDLRCWVRAEEDLPGFRIAVIVHRLDGNAVGGAFGPDVLSLKKGEEAEFKVRMEDFQLTPGRYCCELRLGRGDPTHGRTEYDAVFDVFHFEIQPETSEDGAAGYWEPQWGPVRFGDCELARVGA